MRGDVVSGEWWWRYRLGAVEYQERGGGDTGEGWWSSR